MKILVQMILLSITFWLAALRPGNGYNNEQTSSLLICVVNLLRHKSATPNTSVSIAGFVCVCFEMI